MKEKGRKGEKGESVESEDGEGRRRRGRRFRKSWAPPRWSLITHRTSSTLPPQTSAKWYEKKSRDLRRVP